MCTIGFELCTLCLPASRLKTPSHLKGCEKNGNERDYYIFNGATFSSKSKRKINWYHKNVFIILYCFCYIIYRRSKNTFSTIKFSWISLEKITNCIYIFCLYSTKEANQVLKYFINLYNFVIFENFQFKNFHTIILMIVFYCKCRKKVLRLLLFEDVFCCFLLLVFLKKAKLPKLGVILC